jgi:hypothetical protein
MVLASLETGEDLLLAAGLNHIHSTRLQSQAEEQVKRASNVLPFRVLRRYVLLWYYYVLRLVASTVVLGENIYYCVLSVK